MCSPACMKALAGIHTAVASERPVRIIGSDLALDQSLAFEKVHAHIVDWHA